MRKIILIIQSWNKKVIKELKIKYYEIIVIDDGSTDNTYFKVKKQIFKKYKLKRNLGIGGLISMD